MENKYFYNYGTQQCAKTIFDNLPRKTYKHQCLNNHPEPWQLNTLSRHSNIVNINIKLNIIIATPGNHQQHCGSTFATTAIFIHIH